MHSQFFFSEKDQLYLFQWSGFRVVGECGSLVFLPELVASLTGRAEELWVSFYADLS
jgi:hypothetical protein